MNNIKSLDNIVDLLNRFIIYMFYDIDFSSDIVKLFTILFEFTWLVRGSFVLFFYQFVFKWDNNFSILSKKSLEIDN